MKTYQIFQAGAVLGAISVPSLGVVASIDTLSENTLLVTAIAVAGFMFVISALFSFADMFELSGVPDMRIREAVPHLLSAGGAILLGLVALLVFQITLAINLYH